MIILLHSSKTMRRLPSTGGALRKPQLLDKAKRLADYIKTLSAADLGKVMRISPALAKKTKELFAEWTVESSEQTLAIDAFLGDIYSGLRAQELSAAERDYADKTLGILSGLYGVIRPYDGIYPYRLEMGYKLPDSKFASLYEYWGEAVAQCLPKKGLIVNLASEEFADVILPFVDQSRVVAPKFLTVNPKTGEPSFVVVHAKIARGAFAHWLIVSRVDDVKGLEEFDELGYRYNKKLSAQGVPTFVCEEFGGKGLSIKTLK